MPLRLITAALLVVSLSANVFLLTRTEAPGRPNPSDANHASATTTADLLPPRTSAPATIATPNPTSSSDSTSTTWEQFATRDPATLAQRLRAAGFSPHAARAAVIALVREIHEAEVLRVAKATPLDPYWKVGGNAGESLHQNREMTQRFVDRLREVNRYFPELRAEDLAQQRARFGPLPDEKLEQLGQLERDYNSMRSELMTRNVNGTPTMPWSKDALRILELEFERERASLLTPAELEEYNFRNSRTARSMDRSMAVFNPTQAEFREIYRLRAKFDEQFSYPGVPASKVGQDRTEAQRSLEASLQASLGESRYAEYQRAHDAGFQAAHLVTRQLGLPGDTALNTHAVQRETEQKVAALYSDRSQTPEQRSAALATLLGEAQGRLSQLLTDDGLDQYRTQAPWLRNLERQANSPSTPKP